METLNYRMIQRKGKESDLPTKPRDGEIYITTDTNVMYFGSSGKMNKVPTMDDVANGSGGSSITVDNTLTSTSTTEALSANMGRELKATIDNHTQNSFMHVTPAEKNQWNAKASTTVASATTDGLMSSNDKIKLNSIAVGATHTTINDTLTSTSTTEALSANQGRILKDLIDANGGSGGGNGSVAVIDDLNSTDTTSALSANQGKVINDKITSHVNDSTSHVTSSEKSIWNSKADNTVATISTNGLMSSADKDKLDSIATGANNYILPVATTTTIGGVKAGTNITIASDGTISSTVSGGSSYTHPTGDGNLHVPATGTTNNGKVLKAGTTAGSISWGTLTKSDVGLGNVDNTSDLNKPISIAMQTALDAKASTAVATAITDGLMSSADKTKLNSIATGANSVTVVDNLTSTSTTSALSSNMGNTLNNNLTSLDNRVTQHLDENISDHLAITRDASLIGSQTIALPQSRQPKSVNIIASCDDDKWSFGQVSFNGQSCMAKFGDGKSATLGNTAVYIGDNYLNYTKGIITFVDTGDLIIDWAHVGTGATGTITLLIQVLHHGVTIQ